MSAELTRREDLRLLRGAGLYVADLALPRLLDAAFVRSPVAHGVLVDVDVSAARGVPGVLGAWSARDLPGLPVVPPFGQPGVAEGRDWPSLATDRVRHVGQPVAVVLAADRYRAEDGVDAVRHRIDELPALVDPAAALEGPELFPGHANVAVEAEFGDPVPQEVWERAHLVVEGRYRQQLVAPVSLEARAFLAVPEEGRLHVRVSHQAPHRLRDNLAQALHLAPDAVRVQVPDAGGAFGSKSATFPEYLVVAALALRLDRPVRWVEDRAEAFTAHTHGRGQDQRTRLALDADGRFLAFDLDVLANLGAYPHTGVIVPQQTALMATGAYATEHVHARMRCVVTTTSPTAPYRGAGRPEAASAVERTVELAARRLGVDPVELRRRNFVPPEAFPYDTPTGRTYDSGQYARSLERCVEALGLDGWRAEQRRRREDPAAPPLGVGFCSYVERSGGDGPMLREFGSVEALADGTFVARCGTSSTGQGHETALAQVAADVLGVPLDRVRYVAADTAEVASGVGSFGSRSMQMGGAALHLAAGELVDLARRRAARWASDGGPEVPAGSVTWRSGGLDLPGGRRVETAELVAATGALRADHEFRQDAAFPFGSYAAVVEVDPELGDVRVLRLVAVDDYGVVVNPVLTRGQTVGSIVQGVGQALYEDVPHGEDGVPQLHAGLFDYLLPTLSEVPPMTLEETVTPNPGNPLGAKGAGEAGCIGVPPAVVNAVADALQLEDPGTLQMPLTPERVWRAAAGARAGAAS
ncbi:xanthine dehydrogenase family protein molybdopterin-binding subunit [Kineococcus sp. SYSU DK005]|uniref:xanthine dehydrogenase family protein molybdopterin-binding subunit n=1 Tax=Kineococcus sp. SYSU DK005 TaxID=3383126 RepID=UPI003D7E757C